ncbi:hypothetical protein [Weissella sp. MSCH1]|uniref:hypothetical protein n=1 Tax=Weissella sp. MSCH1 TaxID=3383343 RepID=UPI003896A643
MVTVSDNNKIPQIMWELEQLNHLRVRVGIFGGSGGGNGKITLVEIANINEFGTRNGHVPERSFVRSTYSEKVGDWSNFAKRLTMKVATGSLTAYQAYSQLGARMTRDIKRKITDLRSPANAPSTIKKKGSSNPLIDTGAMRAAVTWRVD